MSGVSLDARDPGDRGPYRSPYRALTLMEWRSRRLSPVPGARARLGSMSRGTQRTWPGGSAKKCRAPALWICG